MYVLWGFPGGTSGKEAACQCRSPGLDPDPGRSAGGGHVNPLQYSCPGNPKDRGAWRATVHGVDTQRVRHNRETKQQHRANILLHCLKKNSICNTYAFLLLKQWAAVRIHHSLRIDPPQRWLPFSRICICQGKSLMFAGTPPMISKTSDFSEVFILWPHCTKSRKQEEGGETQGLTQWSTTNGRICILV